MDSILYAVWPLICEILAEVSPATLYYLSLVSRVCHSAAAPYTCRQLKLVISSHQRLQRQVKHLIDHREQHSFFAYVRQVDLCGKMLPEGSSTDAEDRLLQSVRAAAETKRMRYVDVCGASELEPFYDSSFISDRTQPLNTDVEYDDLWKPLATLIATFEHLTKFSYRCASPFPSCVLGALHTYQNSCCIHLHSSRLLSLYSPTICHAEISLFQSTALREVNIQYSLCDSHGNEDHTADMVRKAIQLAPNIQHVRLQFCRPLTRALRARQSQLGSSNSRTDHVSFPESSAQKAALLTFCAQSGVNFEWRTWTEAIDASRLRSLNLGRVRKIEYFDPLIDSITLPSLEKLALRLEMAWDHDAQRKVKTFMGGLRPLNTLRLHGMMDSSLVDSIIERHGSALRNLLMDPYCFNSDARPWSLTATIIGQLSVKCPRLRELGLTVPRFKGNHDEITCYQALGSFHFLEKLCLNLDCSISEPGFFGREQWSAFDLMEYSSITTSAIQICNGDIRDILINAAVDKDLVRSIWENILSYQKRPTSLRWMMISPRRSGYISSVRPAGIGHKVEHMSRSFELTKTGKTAIDVIEIGQARRERQDSEWREIEEQALREMGQRIDSDLEDIMRTIWPFREGIDDWRLFWSSFPLSQ